LWRRPNGSAERTRLEAEAKLRAARRATAHITAMAPHIAQLPAEELAERLRRAMTPRGRT
jgi:hypothetical protein